MCIVSLLSSLLLLTSHVWLPVLSLNNLYFLGNKPQLPTVKKRKAVEQLSCPTSSQPLKRKTYERRTPQSAQPTTPFHVNDNVGMNVDDCLEEAQISIATQEECNAIPPGNSMR